MTYTIESFLKQLVTISDLKIFKKSDHVTDIIVVWDGEALEIRGCYGKEDDNGDDLLDILWLYKKNKRTFYLELFTRNNRSLEINFEESGLTKNKKYSMNEIYYSPKIKQ